MKKLRKLLSLAMAFVLALALAIPAFAAKPEFEIVGTTLNKYNGPGGNVTIPSGVTTIARNAFARNKTLTGVTMPDSVTTIGNNAFFSCEALKNVTFSSGLTSIGDEAFNRCSSLTSVTLPNTVTSIGRHAFANCSSMKSLTLSTGLVSMGNWAFTNCSSLTTISVPGSVSVIPTYAFSGCSSVKTIILYEGVTKTEANAFRGCPSVTRLTLPASIREIGTATFRDSKGLRDVYYGGSEEQWNTIKGVKSDLFAPSVLDGAPVHYNSPMPTMPPSYNDVPISQYYAGPVAWASGLGIANGTGSGKFSPAQQCTQEQILTFLYRGARTEDGPFVAASASDMAAAVEWAREKGMIDGSFVGSTPCTRATAVYFIWQAFDSPNASASTFNDVPAGVDYAASVSWAVQQGITDGTGTGNFSPNTTCTRGQIVTFLYRAYS